MQAAKELAADSQRYDLDIAKRLMAVFVTEGFGRFVNMDKSLDEPS